MSAGSNGRSGTPSSSDDETTFEALRDDHGTQRTLVSVLVGTVGDSDGRREVYDTIRRELSERLIHHIDEEETEVFPVAGRVLDDDVEASLAAGHRSDMERRRNDV